MASKAWSHQQQGTTRAVKARGAGKLQANIFAFFVNTMCLARLQG